ncbi:hypothetical protein [Embleya sp. AB8]|uniref:hypothetical protein n=1 Tax=Embleya sp. AB8 TaxID=3156304 RepID=UPI003C70DB49
MDYFHQQLDGHHHADVMLGPRHLIPTVIVQYEFIVRLLERASGGARRRLLQVAAAYCGLATWLYQDTGDLGQATVWANQTLELAHRADDAQLVSHALTNKAMGRDGRRRRAFDGRAVLVGPSGRSAAVPEGASASHAAGGTRPRDAR